MPDVLAALALMPAAGFLWQLGAGLASWGWGLLHGWWSRRQIERFATKLTQLRDTRDAVGRRVGGNLRGLQ